MCTCLTFHVYHPFCLVQVKELNAEVNRLVEKRMLATDPLGDKASMFRQQANLVARKKAAAAEELVVARDNCANIENRLSEASVQLSKLNSHPDETNPSTTKNEKSDLLEEAKPPISKADEVSQSIKQFFRLIHESQTRGQSSGKKRD
ncbi:unnamed protein product [Protopolystoma xenopodis]|uniref:Uncharacterized protein n=1 Tax=Protopolystoma xenopodis TaxID=117903 RepID=A0A3S5CPN3_9PLAT|nr:unnamed protein product [Protopolystoma xenopodis]